MKAVKKKIYEIGIPVCEVWIFRVSASSKVEAMELFRSHDPSVEQIGSVSGTEEYVIEVGAVHRHKRAKHMIKTKRRFTDMSASKKPSKKAQSLVAKLRKKGWTDDQIREHFKKSRDR